MADLDDFFAKKDRKKNKSTKKFSTTEDVAKKLEDSAKKTEKVKKDRVPEGEDSTTPAYEQDEWKDFEEEKKDYSGLKIGNLSIQSPPEGAAGAKESVDEQQQELEPGQDVEKKVGPWKRIDATTEVSEEPKIVVEEKPQPSQQRQSYVPPSLRNAGQTVVQPSRIKTKAAPDIHNEEFFPTLSKTSEHKKNRNEGSFEVVQHNRSTSYSKAEQSKISSTQGPKLSLGNRYNTLSNDS